MARAGVAPVEPWALDREAVRTSAVRPAPFPAVAELPVVGPRAHSHASPSPSRPQPPSSPPRAGPRGAAVARARIRYRFEMTNVLAAVEPAASLLLYNSYIPIVTPRVCYAFTRGPHPGLHRACRARRVRCRRGCRARAPGEALTEAPRPHRIATHTTHRARSTYHAENRYEPRAREKARHSTA